MDLPARSRGRAPVEMGQSPQKLEPTCTKKLGLRVVREESDVRATNNRLHVEDNNESTITDRQTDRITTHKTALAYSCVERQKSRTTLYGRGPR